jgi:hypothetical protein
MVDDRRDWPFAFLNVCDLLALDANAVRQSLRDQLATVPASERSDTSSRRGIRSLHRLSIVGWDEV